MSTVREIEQAVRALTPDALAEFREWFAAFDADQWDREFEQDARSGRLDSLADKALSDLDAGRCTEL
jgi:hypothetical protein